METAALLMSLSGATDLPETASMALDTVTYPFLHASTLCTSLQAL